ncbi:unnamed protein product [Musa acuminata subsp. burmannicoides]
MENGAGAAKDECRPGQMGLEMAAENGDSQRELAGGADGGPPKSEDGSKDLGENEVFEEAMEAPQHSVHDSHVGMVIEPEGVVEPADLRVGEKNLEVEMVGSEGYIDSTDAAGHDQRPDEQEMVGLVKLDGAPGVEGNGQEDSVSFHKLDASTGSQHTDQSSEEQVAVESEEGMPACDESDGELGKGEDEKEFMLGKLNSVVPDSKDGKGMDEVTNGSYEIVNDREITVGDGNTELVDKKSENEEPERVRLDGLADLLDEGSENGQSLEVTSDECGADNDAESHQVSTQQMKDISAQSLAVSEEPSKVPQLKDISAEVNYGFATNGHAAVQKEGGSFATNGHATMEKQDGSSCSHVTSAANDSYVKDDKAVMHETTKKLQKESVENLGHLSSTSSDNKKSSSPSALPSTLNHENSGGPGLSSRPAGLGSSAPLLEPSVRSLQQPRTNGSAPRRVSQPSEEPPNDDGEENDETREKLQMIRVKFLRLAHRLGQTPHNVVVAQVLYRLGLAEQLKRNTNRPGVFSFDRASVVAEQLEAAGQETLDFSCTIMVIGKTGVGKSATINSIFDEVKLPTDAFQVGTKKVQEVVGMVQGIKVRVIDTPGLFSSSLDQNRNEKTLHSVKRFINKTPPDIVLYFDRLDMQSRDYGDAPLLRTITDIFGASIWFNAIVVLTHAASAPPDGPNGSPLTYEMFVTQRSHVVQQAIRQAAGDVRLMNPVSLVENHSACRMNRAGQRANMLLKLQDGPPGRTFGSRPRVPPLPFLLSSLLQSRPPPKLPEEQLGDDDNLDEDLGEISDSDEGSDYDELPPFKPLTNGPASVPVPMPDFVLPNSFDSDNPTHRYRFLDSSSQWLVRPVLDSQGWDHDIGYEGLNVERVFVIKDKMPLSVSGQLTKDKKECSLQMEVASSIKHSESKSTSLCLDMQTVGKDVAYTLRGDTRFKNFRRNNTAAGVSVTVLGDSLSAGLKFEDKLMISQRLRVLMSGGAMTGRGDVAYGGRLEATLRDKDYPIRQALSTLQLSIMDWHGDLTLGCNVQSQLPLDRGTNLIGHANLSNKGTGQIGIRLNSSEHFQIVLLALFPIIRNVQKILFNHTFPLLSPFILLTRNIFVFLSNSHRVDKDSVAARKVQKADREKLRRDRLNEQFLELGNALDPDRPKNDKATILGDTIQMLKDLTAQVNRLKSEYNSLSEESRELTQEKNELRDEKAKLKSEIDDLNVQYQQRLRVFYPWATMDPSLVIGRPPYPFPMPVPIPSAAIPIHPVHSYPFFHGPIPGTISNPCSTYMPNSPSNPQVEQSSNQHINQNMHIKDSRSQTSSHQDSKSKPSDQHQRNSGQRSDDFSDVATELELKTPGSAVHSQSTSAHDEDLSSEMRKGKQLPQHKGSGASTCSSSSRCSSSCSVPDDNSNDVRDGSGPEKQ